MNITSRSKRDDRTEGSLLVGESQRVLIATKSGGFWVEETSEGHLNIYVNGVDRLTIQPEGHSSIVLQCNRKA